MSAPPARIGTARDRACVAAARRRRRWPPVPRHRTVRPWRPARCAQPRSVHGSGRRRRVGAVAGEVRDAVAAFVSTRVVPELRHPQMPAPSDIRATWSAASVPCAAAALSGSRPRSGVSAAWLAA